MPDLVLEIDALQTTMARLEAEENAQVAIFQEAEECEQPTAPTCSKCTCRS